MKRKTIDQNSWDAVQMVLRGITLIVLLEKKKGLNQWAKCPTSLRKWRTK